MMFVDHLAPKENFPCKGGQDKLGACQTIKQTHTHTHTHKFYYDFTLKDENEYVSCKPKKKRKLSLQTSKVF